MLDIAVIWICKIVYWVLRRLGRHGAALPGLIAEKLRPSLLSRLTNLPEGLVIVSGTNGKTTTTSLLAQVLKRSGLRVFTNHSGSNMTRGLLASIIRFSSLSGKLPFDVAILEVDEAYAAKLSPVLKPRGSILTNVLRDQLDRFGEIDYTASLLATLAENTTELVVYNSCDSRLYNIGQNIHSVETVSFGFKKNLEQHFPDDDSLYSKESNYRLSEYTLEDVQEGHTSIKRPGGSIQVSNSYLRGWHNALNLTSVVAMAAKLFNCTDTSLFENLKSSYGRGEVLNVAGTELVLQLVKNPLGFRMAMDVEPGMPAMIVINDMVADGRDVSWLWDVDMQRLRSRPQIWCAGTRAFDIALRLKYEEINVDKKSTKTHKIIDDFISSNSSGVVFLTYTAMLDIRKYLNKNYKHARPAK